MKKSARVEVFGRRQILERARQLAARRHGTAGGWFGHGAETLALVTRSTNLKIQKSPIYRTSNLELNDRLITHVPKMATVCEESLQLVQACGLSARIHELNGLRLTPTQLASRCKNQARMQRLEC